MTVACQAGIELVSPAPEDCYVDIYRLLKEEFSHQTMDVLAPKTFGEFNRKAKQDLENGGMTFAALKDGIVMGGVWFEAIGDGQCLGHLVFERQGISSTEKLQASRQAIKALFDEGCRKIVWTFFADNRAFRIFLKRLGAKHEGLLRQHLRRGDELVDAEIMASFLK